MKTKEKSQNLFIIFGTSQGLGRAIYQYAAQFAGNDFIIVNRRADAAVLKNSKKITIDLSKIITPAKLLQLFHFSARKSYKNIYLINNASTIQPIKPIGEAKRKKLVGSVYVNFLNYAIIVNEFIKQTKHLKSTKKKILNISSGAASSPHYGIAAYCSAKSALEMLTECIFIEQQALKQVKILALRPGIINTSMQKLMRDSSKNDFLKADLYKKLFNNNKLSSPEDIAREIYTILENDKYWVNPILDITDVK